MLQLINIKKEYKTAGSSVHALKGIDLRFRKNEFVSILGASGCGKTTMLNIIGGLDKYTSGDLVINGKSTKTYRDHDWDVYRNHRIGFVFQSYNLIPHQTVLGNVEIALTIAGVSKAERKRRAAEALRKVGLGKELKKRPNQLSGGQMQRVAIARALVNNPEILLADEPTGALDTETSVQIMDLIREIAGERLVIMVTHNPELAEEYSSRIVRLQDGLVISDSNPYVVEESKSEENEAPMSEVNEEITAEERLEAFAKALEETAAQAAVNGEAFDGEKVSAAMGLAEEKLVEKREPKVDKKAEKKAKKQAKKEEKRLRESSSMSFKTSLGLSARNLAMKKGRTVVTSVAGSIGIISVCLVLALSNGFNGYILKTQEDMLSSNPLQINKTTVDVGAIMSGMSSAKDMPDLDKIGDNVYVNSFLTNMAQGMTVENDLSDAYLKYIREDLDKDLYETITYDYGMKLENSLYTTVSVLGTDDVSEEVVMSLSELKSYYTEKLSQQDEKYASLAYLVDYLGSVYGKMPGTEDVQAENFGKYVLSQYDVIKGEFPKNANEAVLVVGDNNDVTDLTLAQLGFIEEQTFLNLFNENAESGSIPFASIIGKQFAMNFNDAVYTKTTEGKYVYAYEGRRDETKLDLGADKGEMLTISGILRLKEGMNYGCLGSSGLFLTEAASAKLFEGNKNSQIVQTVKGQMERQSAVLQEYASKAQQVQSQIAQLDPASPDYQQQVAILSGSLLQYLAENREYITCAASTLEDYYMTSSSSMQGAASIPSGIAIIYGDSAVRHIGGENKVNGISIYTDSFENKEGVLAHLDAWNETYKNDTAKQVKYTDTVGMMMSMVEMMLNAITVVLVAFTAISLVVSSVMIGIITYVSVVERVKEIGVLRSLGARKKDIKNLFNAETFIIGFSSGLFGVVVTYLLSIGINALLGTLTGISTLAALPVASAVIMVAISVGLTLISGLIPANAAAKKDPVVALRTE